jgi:hypothetical protein
MPTLNRIASPAARGAHERYAHRPSATIDLLQRGCNATMRSASRAAAARASGVSSHATSKTGMSVLRACWRNRARRLVAFPTYNTTRSAPRKK